jgi:hypothetical protein
LTEADKKLVGDLKTSLDRLNGLRAVEITVSGKFARSKIAWKLGLVRSLNCGSDPSPAGLVLWKQ